MNCDYCEESRESTTAWQCTECLHWFTAWRFFPSDDSDSTQPRTGKCASCIWQDGWHDHIGEVAMLGLQVLGPENSSDSSRAGS